MPQPTTSARSPAAILARRTACTATDSGSTIAACSNDTASGTRQTMRSGTTTASAKAPSCRYSPGETPTTRRRSHRFTCPERQNAHSPQWIVESKVTRSPGLNAAHLGARRRRRRPRPRGP